MGSRFTLVGVCVRLRVRGLRSLSLLGTLVDGSGPCLNIDLVCTCFRIDICLCFDEGGVGVVGRSCVLSGVD